MSLLDSISETNTKAAKVSEKYFEKSYKYYKLKIFEQLTISVGMVFKVFIIGILALIGTSFLGIALAIFIGKAMNNIPMGFIFVGILFFLLSLIIFLLRKHINNFVIKKLSKKFFT